MADPHARRRQQVERECNRLGVRIEIEGTLFHLRGRGVNLTTTDLAFILLDELRPAGQRRKLNERPK